MILYGSIGTVVAACRDPSSAANLHALKRMAGNENRIDLVKMDIEDQTSLESAAEYVKSKYGVSKQFVALQVETPFAMVGLAEIERERAA